MRWAIPLALLVGLLVSVGVPYLVGASDAQAQGGRAFSECAAVRVPAHPRTVPVPAGFAVVGGAGPNGAVFMIVCR